MRPNPEMMRPEADDDEESAVSKLNGSSTWWDLIFAHQKDMFNNVGAYKQLREGMSQVYGLMTKDQEYMRKQRLDHTKRGAMRSGQGTPESAHRRQKQFEERERIETMYENKEVPTDIPTSNKLYELWLEKQKDRPGLRQDDK